MKNDSLRQYIGSRPCHILGLGVSNLPLAKELCRMGLTVTVRDRATPQELGPDAEELARRGVVFFDEKAPFSDFSRGILFRSPGIRPDREDLEAACALGYELSSEIELFLQLTDATTFAVTGSDGKTTSTTLTGLFLAKDAEQKKKRPPFVGGNIGEPLLHRLCDVGADDRVVMELSSFQLMTVSCAPHFCAITNLSPNHMDWHRGSMEEYVNAKKRILGKSTRRFVTNADCAITHEIAREVMLRRKKEEDFSPALYLFSSTKTSFEELFPDGAEAEDRALYLKNGNLICSDGACERLLLARDEIQIPGLHNVENFLVAIGLTLDVVAPAVYHDVAASFFGVEHRLQKIRTLGGVDYFNSSIDSSPTRTAAALSALEGRDVVIICGGYDKKLSFVPLAESLCRHARAVVLTGATAEAIREALLSHPDYRPDRPTLVLEPDFEKAVCKAKELGRPGGCVLLSPACASFDAFRNFAHRGNTFRAIVERFEN